MSLDWKATYICEPSFNIEEVITVSVVSETIVCLLNSLLSFIFEKERKHFKEILYITY